MQAMKVAATCFITLAANAIPTTVMLKRMAGRSEESQQKTYRRRFVGILILGLLINVVLVTIVNDLVFPIENPYAHLSIGRWTPQDMLRRAYKQALLRLHPDKNQHDESANEKFFLMQRSYEILQDEKIRRYYEYQLPLVGKSLMDLNLRKAEKFDWRSELEIKEERFYQLLYFEAAATAIVLLANLGLTRSLKAVFAHTFLLSIHVLVEAALIYEGCDLFDRIVSVVRPSLPLYHFLEWIRLSILIPIAHSLTIYFILSKKKEVESSKSHPRSIEEEETKESVKSLNSNDNSQRDIISDKEVEEHEPEVYETPKPSKNILPQIIEEALNQPSVQATPRRVRCAKRKMKHPQTPKPIASTPKPNTSLHKALTSTPKTKTSPQKAVVSTPNPITSTPKPIFSTPKHTATPKPNASPQKSVVSPPKPMVSSPKTKASPETKPISRKLFFIQFTIFSTITTVLMIYLLLVFADEDINLSDIIFSFP
eukprot:TRINITY_DN8329_c0_g1_i2.p1 TRINITY_DN8329_c0_g1~~TRINITY_DN8329_c0_g1_i2.p1  ORF type:complete len:483 (-),score=47.97 TRINITY_DN8329_c0_g1_i2:110-1558(-)